MRNHNADLDDLDVRRRMVHCIRAPISVLVTALIAVAVVNTPADPAHACSCDDQPLATYADEAVAAFVGRQTERDVQDEAADLGTELTFDVEEVFLGELSPTFRVRTAADGNACGVDLEGFGSVGVVAFGSLDAPTVGACPMTVPRDELKSVFGSGSAPSDTDSTDDGTTTSNTAARAALIGLLLVVLVAGAVLVRRRRRRPPAEPA